MNSFPGIYLMFVAPVALLGGLAFYGATEFRQQNIAERGFIADCHLKWSREVGYPTRNSERLQMVDFCSNSYDSWLAKQNRK